MIREINILTIQQYNAFFSNLDTITGQMDKDLNKYIKKRIRKQSLSKVSTVAKVCRFS